MKGESDSSETGARVSIQTTLLQEHGLIMNGKHASPCSTERMLLKDQLYIERCVCEREGCWSWEVYSGFLLRLLRILLASSEVADWDVEAGRCEDCC